MSKAEEILDKHLENRSWTKTVPKYGNLYNTLLDAVSEALTMPVVVGRSEQFKCDCGCTNHYKNEMYDSVKCADCGTVYARI